MPPTRVLPHAMAGNYGFCGHPLDASPFMPTPTVTLGKARRLHLLSPLHCPSHNTTVAIVGGGLAGTAAAVAACEAGLRVELFERSRSLGGRAGSFRDGRTGLTVDFCQHVAMGCCTMLADFCRRIDAADCFRRDRRLHFFSPEGKRHDFAAAAWLPAPWHLLPGVLRSKYLTFGERWDIIRALRRLTRRASDDRPEETIGTWLRRHGQSQRAIDRFWSVVLVSALSETIDRASLSAARKVFLDGFLASRRAYELVVPTVPLSEIFDWRVRTALAKRNVAVHLGTPIRRIEGDARRATAIVLPDGTRRAFDFVIAAVPWHRVRSLFPEAMLAAMPALEHVGEIPPAPITAVHLWFDCPITRLPHAVLVGKLGQWMFQGNAADPKIASAEADSRPPAERMILYTGKSIPQWSCQVVISASHSLLGRRREDVVAEVCDELKSIWPGAGYARLLHWRVMTHPSAVFSCVPDLDRLRPPQQTPLENLMLAGDWTATGWPATMEGAVRSGYLAAEAVLHTKPRPLVAPG